MKKFKISSMFVFVVCFLMVSSILMSAVDIQVRIRCPGMAQPGEELKERITVWVRNMGDQTAPTFALDLVLSSDLIVPIDFAGFSATFKEDCLLRGGREHVKNLKPGASWTKVKLNGPNTIPPDTPPGVYHLAAVVDPGKVVSETSERNNVATCKIRIFKSMPRFRVTRVSAVVSPRSFTGKCPKRFEFTGYITTNGKGTVKYKWIRSDGAVAPEKTLSFSSATTQKIQSYWLLGGAGKTYKNMWKAVQIIAPNKRTSNRALFSLTCTKGYEPCGIRLTRLSKTSGYPGDTFKIYGVWGATQGTKIPCINKGKMNKLIVLNWSDSEIEVKIPAGLAPGKYRVGVYCNDLSQGGSYSSGWTDFTILQKRTAIKPPKRFFLDFVDAYLVYEHGKKVLQIATEGNVLSYGGDWERVRIYNYLYDLRQKFWKGFYWRVNTSRKEVYRYKGTNFGKIGDSQHEKLTNIRVDVVGNKENPTRFLLRFRSAYLVYVPSSKTLQIVAMGNTQGNVLSYGSDWQKCNMYSYLYHLKQNVWKGFYWKINTSRKQVYRIRGGTFCKLGGSETILKMRVRVVN